MSLPKIGVVIPAYNADRFIGKTISSVQAQLGAEWECVVVDDGSTDGTAHIITEIALKDPRIRLIRQRNCGVAAARNFGFSLLSPSVKFVVFMDNDDMFLPRALEHLANAIVVRREVVGAHGIAHMIDVEDRRIGNGGFTQQMIQRRRAQGGRLIHCGIDEPTTFEVVLVNAFYPPGTIMWKREVLIAAGLFDTALRGASDLDMLIRVARCGSLAFLNELVVYYRRHDKNESNCPDYLHDEIRYVRRKAFFATQNTPEQRLAVKKAYRAWQRNKLSEKARDLKLNYRKGNVRMVLMFSVHMLGHLLFFIRGYPTLRG